MRVLKLKRMKEGDETYKDVFMMLLESPVPNLAAQAPVAMTTKEIRELGPIAVKIDGEECPAVGCHEFVIEDGDYTKIKERLDKWQWPNGMAGLREFLNDFDTARTVSMEDWLKERNEESLPDA